jgi:hypothetical protein
MRTSLDRIELALEALLSGQRPPDSIAPLTGIRELYHMLSGDYEMSGMFQPDRLEFGSVNSSTMANMVANVLNKRVAQEFQNYPLWWAPIVNEEDFQSAEHPVDLTRRRGRAPTVAEGATYTELTWDDSKETGTFIKKGGYLGLTMEADRMKPAACGAAAPGPGRLADPLKSISSSSPSLRRRPNLTTEPPCSTSRGNVVLPPPA